MLLFPVMASIQDFAMFSNSKLLAPFIMPLIISRMITARIVGLVRSTQLPDFERHVSFSMATVSKFNAKLISFGCLKHR